MNLLGNILISSYGIGAISAFILGVRQCTYFKNPYGLTRMFYPYGIFVWADALLIGFFWISVSVLAFAMQNVHFFLVVQAIFWMVRSAGEIVYWFLQQFAETKRDTPSTLWGHQLFPGESIWIAYQLFWQLILVVSSVCLVYLL